MAREGSLILSNNKQCTQTRENYVLTYLVRGVENVLKAKHVGYSRCLQQQLRNFVQSSLFTCSLHKSKEPTVIWISYFTSTRLTKDLGASVWFKFIV